MAVYKESTAISAAYVGTTAVSKIYLGSTEVWSASAPSFTPYAPAKMTKNGAQAWPQSTGDITPWTEVDTGGYTSTVQDTGLDLLVPASTSEGKIVAAVPYTGSNAARTHTLILYNVTTSATLATSTMPGAASGTPIVEYVGALTANDKIKVRASAGGSSCGTITDATPYCIIDGAPTVGGVAFDAVGAGTHATPFTSGQAYTYSHTMGGSGSNTIALVAISWYNASMTVYTDCTRTVTFGGQTMTSAGGVNWGGTTSIRFTELFYLLNPTSGSKTVSVTLTGSGTFQWLVTNSVSYLNCSGLNGSAVANYGNSTAPSSTVQSAAGNRVVTAFGHRYALSAPVGVQRAVDNTYPSAAVDMMITDLFGGIDSTFQGATGNTSGLWGTIAQDLAKVA